MDVLGSAGFGAITGGLFGWLGKREERENMKMKFDHDINLLKAQAQVAVATAKMGIEQAKVAGSLAIEKVEAQAFSNSQKVTSKFADIMKACIRPIILGLLMYQTYKFSDSLETLTGGLQGLDSTEVMGLYRLLVLSVTGLTSTAVGWYFASRSSKQFDRLVELWHKTP